MTHELNRRTLLKAALGTAGLGALGSLPAGVTVSDHAKNYDQVHWFVRNITQRVGEEKKVLALLKEGVTLWVYFP